MNRGRGFHKSLEYHHNYLLRLSVELVGKRRASLISFQEREERAYRNYARVSLDTSEVGG